MAFCGQCGLLLPPNPVACPRCGSAVTARSESVNQYAANTPTVISRSDQIQDIQQSPQSAQEPGQFAVDTSQMQRDESLDNRPTLQNTAFPAYTEQPYFAPPDYASHASNDAHDGSLPSYTTIQGAPYPDYLLSSGPHYPPPLVAPQSKINWAMILSLLILLVLVIATAFLLFVGPHRILQLVQSNTAKPQETSAPSNRQFATSAVYSAEVSPTAAIVTPTVQTGPTPERQAQSVIERYYAAINGQDYQTAYNLWLNYPQSYQSFANGFANTSHDDLTFGDVVQQSDGTVQVNVLIIATSTASQQTTFQGYYIVEQGPDGTWKIISANIHGV